MKITIFSVGKIKEKFFVDAINEYQKRLSAYCNFKIVEVTDEKTYDTSLDSLNELTKEKEGQRLLKVIPENAYKIGLVIDAKEYDSIAFSKKIEKLAVEGKSDIAFIIGGSCGLSNSVISACDEKISFSKMTFPHQLMRVILSEQIYRAFRIMKNEPYHK